MRNLFFDELQTSELVKEMTRNVFPVTSPTFLPSQTLKSFLADRKEIKLFEISNVAKIINSRFRGADFGTIPNLAPPFLKMWIEYSSSFRMTRKMHFKKLASLVFSGAITYEEFRAAKMSDVPDEWKKDVKAGVYINSIRMSDFWLLNCFGFIRGKVSDDLKSRSEFFCQIKVSPDGKLREDFSQTIKLETDIELEGVYSSFYLQADVIRVIYKFFYAIGLLHCKNIVTEEVGGKRETVKRRHRNKGTRHHVLKIIPMKKVKAYQEKGASSLSKGDVSLHVRRGHFKTYTPEAPLFGVHSGTFWWEAHTAGKAEHGIVTKDYQIHSAREP
jgi:hypothetical protein